MDLVGRLKEYLSKNGIPVTQFADTCNIPRPTISQIVNGRNKKISDEIISKIHQAFPDLSIMWLMFGEGGMLNNGYEKRILGSSFEKDTKNENFQGNLFSDSATKEMETIQSMKISTRTKADSLSSVNLQNSSKELVSDKRKTITNIVVYFSDNSFQSFRPE